MNHAPTALKMKLGIVFITTMVLLLAGCVSTTQPQPIACTAEAKICPDGSAVGRVGPNCEFAPCPGSNSSAGN